MNLKSICLLASFLCMHSLDALSQHFLGAKAGANINQIYMTDYLLNTRIGQLPMYQYHYGITYQHLSTPNTGLQIDINNIRKGWRQRINNDRDFDGYYQASFDYINLSFLSHLSIGKKNFKAFIDLGPFIGYLFHFSEGITHQEFSNNVAFRYDPNDDLKFEYGIEGRIGVAYLFSFGKIQLDAGYQYGLRNILNHRPTIRDKPSVSTLQTGLASFSYYLPISQLFDKKASD